MFQVPRARPGFRSALRKASVMSEHTLGSSLAELQTYRRAAPQATLVCVVAAADPALGDRLQIVLELAGYAVERAADVDYALARLKRGETLLALLTLRLPEPDGAASYHEVQLVLVLPIAPAAAEQAALAAAPDDERALPSEFAALLGLHPSRLRPQADSPAG